MYNCNFCIALTLSNSPNTLEKFLTLRATGRIDI